MKNKLAKFLEIQLKHSGLNVPMPHPLMIEKSKDRLSEKGQSALANILIDLKDVDVKDCQEIAKLLVSRYFKVFDVLNDVCDDIREDTKATIEYVSENPKYRQTPDEIEGDMFDELESLFGE